MTEADFMRCPTTMQPVDPEIQIPNISIRLATEKFLDENPWAHDFNPMEKLEDIKVWDDIE